MAVTASPYGIKVISSQVGVAVRPHRIPFGIASGFASSIFKGQAVKLEPTAGNIVPVTATGDLLFAVFDGVDYTPLGGRPTVSPFWPGGTTYNANEDMLVYVYPLWLPSTRVQIQADGTVPLTAFGKSFNLSNFAAGSTFTGISGSTVAAAGVGAGVQGQFTLIEFATDVTDVPGDAFTDLIFTVANPQIGFRGQVSAR